jgi:hypothetical protein
VVAPSDRALAKGEGVAKKRAAAGGESGGDAERRLNQQAATPPRPFPGTPTDRAPNATTAGIATDTTTAAAAKPAAPVAPPPPMAAPAPAQAPVAAPVTPAPVAAAPMRERSEPAPNATTARRADAPEARSAAAPARMADAAKSADLSRQAFSNTELQKSAGMLAAAAPPSNIAALRQSLAAEPRRWTWQRGGGSPQPVNERLRNWLAQVDSSAAAHWRRVPLTPLAGEQRDALAGSVGPSRELRLLRDGRLAATLRLDGAVLRWESAATEGHAASALQVPLDQNAVQALAQSFP